MDDKKIKVLVVDDSYFTRKFLCDAIEKDAGLEVVGTAADPYEARDKIVELSPDVMTLDVDMPRMNGIEFLRQLMPQHPMPVLVISAASNSVFDAMQAGAVDFISKSKISDESSKESFISELNVKIKIASIAKVSKQKQASGVAAAMQGKPADNAHMMIALGASTGGTEATNTILKDLRCDLPGIVMVQHMPPVFTKLYAERLNKNCPMEVKEAQDGDEVVPGRALLAPGDYHMEVVKKGGIYRVKVYQGEKVSGHCPSVDVLFSSVAREVGPNALGILLTGMGADGAKGMLEMKKTGATNIGQNKETCVVYGMPMVAKNLGAVTSELPLDQIAKRTYQWHSGMLR